MNSCRFRSLQVSIVLFGGTLLAACGSQNTMEIRPPAQAQCVPQDEPATKPSECCPQGNLSVDIDDLSRCCAGKACCSATNHSHHINSTECDCDPGYEREEPNNDTNYVCKKSYKPDLVFSAEKTTLYYQKDVSGAYRNLWLCINSDTTGKQINRGEYIRIANNGNKDSGPYSVEIGVGSSTTNADTCNVDLRSSGTKMGGVQTFAGPFCCEIFLVRPGSYRLYANVDINEEIDELDEDNNIKLGPSSTTIP